MIFLFWLFLSLVVAIAFSAVASWGLGDFEELQDAM